MIVLDFFGLPGSGKSTISHELAILLKEEGFIVSEPSYDLDHTYSKYVRMIKKLIFATLWIILHFDVSRILVGYLLKKQCLKQSISNIVNIGYKRMYIELNKKTDILIFDEGLAQGAVSACFLNDLDIFETYNIITDKIKFKIINIYVYVTNDKAIERMKARNTFNSRIEQEQDESVRISMMSEFYNLCNKLELNGKIFINSQKNIDINVQKLTTLIKEIL